MFVIWMQSNLYTRPRVTLPLECWHFDRLSAQDVQGVFPLWTVAIPVPLSTVKHPGLVESCPCTHSSVNGQRGKGIPKQNFGAPFMHNFFYSDTLPYKVQLALAALNSVLCLHWQWAKGVWAPSHCTMVQRIPSGKELRVLWCSPHFLPIVQHPKTKTHIFLSGLMPGRPLVIVYFDQFMERGLVR